ncbi:thioredoxin family protein [Mucilaginibacter limnophilus]|uniref:Thioredoxin family protein n=1 Tax=Mucilaginibacter limnophilus TaxID=1932778 RepID=A0A3S2UK94_9SPHI|nr:thioredoxin family protein [Mucilaginibacter limnophilus]RVT98487.1 thioredoxin family protein [Mucilaginibacter limnophilus]
MKKYFFTLVLLWTTLSAVAQIENPVHWRFSFEKINVHQGCIVLHASIDPKWHVYGQHIGKDGPIPTTFKFDPSPDYRLIGKVTETPKPVSGFDQNFDMEISWHEKQVVFRQLIEYKGTAQVSGTIEYMACNDHKCLPPAEEKFQIQAIANTIVASDPISAGNNKGSDKKAQPTEVIVQSSLPQTTSSSYAGIFLAGFLGGLAAFFMPCIYPMIPLTISFFTKQEGTRRKGIRSALLYGLFIIGIYVGLGLSITFIFGSAALNEAASSAAFNLIFFAVLIIFALSFLGAFEITLPSGLVNKMDDRSNKSGLTGLFFMALTLALVSFSCTGPIIGTLLVDAVSKGTYYGPAMGMLGFSSALAIPFTLFAVFPSWLKELPRSGGWLNTVKVSLGFLEFALAFKYLSNVDLAYHWNLLDRQAFLIIWIIVFAFLGFYLAGKIRLSHDTETRTLTLPRLFISMVVFGFTLYMIPGAFGAPLEAISGWLPPPTAQRSDLVSATDNGDRQTSGKKYASLFHAPHGLDAFYDYEQALDESKKLNKPVLLDFTGWSCTNCRKMEASVWSDQAVLERLKKDYVLVSLYVDDKTELAASEQYVSSFSGKKIKTVGQKWSDLQAARFSTNSQPYYVIVNGSGKKLTMPQAFDLNISNYVAFLEKGKIAYEHL